MLSKRNLQVLWLFVLCRGDCDTKLLYAWKPDDYEEEIFLQKHYFKKPQTKLHGIVVDFMQEHEENILNMWTWKNN
jgi:hypothetical protein